MKREGIQLKLDHHRPASGTPFKMAFRWRNFGGPTMNTGLLYMLFSRGSGPVFLSKPIALL